LNLLNCPRCDKVYVKNNRNLCPVCIKIYDEECERCNKYLREHRLITIEELGKATNVEVAQIVRFIRDKRISIASTPNIRYGCETCGTPIREGNLCTPCRSRFNRDLTEAEKLAIEAKKDALRSSYLNRNNMDRKS
jgi:flagellar operon protein (TIGR03826 family)